MLCCVVVLLCCCVVVLLYHCKSKIIVREAVLSNNKICHLSFVKFLIFLLPTMFVTFSNEKS